MRLSASPRVRLSSPPVSTKVLPASGPARRGAGACGVDAGRQQVLDDGAVLRIVGEGAHARRHLGADAAAPRAGSPRRRRGSRRGRGSAAPARAPGARRRGGCRARRGSGRGRGACCAAMAAARLVADFSAMRSRSASGLGVEAVEIGEVARPGPRRPAARPASRRARRCPWRRARRSGGARLSWAGQAAFDAAVGGLALVADDARRRSDRAASSAS